ncbi:MAG: cupin domain-containing protein [Clostridioides sp.]|jgi:ethanolamine utilization protein EutQ|nr:cupin domain-containing protein [Clostridioides sp.]
MKQLICAKDIEEVIAKGENKFYVSDDTIITPSAKDAARLNGIEFTTEPEVKVASPVLNTGGVDNEALLNLIKTMMNKGLLQDMIQALGKNNLPYDVDADPTGLKVVRGNSVKMDVFDTGNPSNKVYFQELVSKDESKMSAGFLTIENSRFDWELTYEEIDYVIEGTLTVEINGKTYTAYPGDVLFVPSGSNVVWGSPDKARLFYTTYPANWADLL